MKAKKLTPPAIPVLTDGERALWHSASQRTVRQAPSAEWLHRAAPAQFYKNAAGQLVPLPAHLLEQSVVEVRATKPLSNADASLRTTQTLRGGVKGKDYTRTDREAQMRDDGRYGLRMVETTIRPIEMTVPIKAVNLDKTPAPRKSAPISTDLSADAQARREALDARWAALLDEE